MKEFLIPLPANTIVIKDKQFIDELFEGLVMKFKK